MNKVWEAERQRVRPTPEAEVIPSAAPGPQMILLVQPVIVQALYGSTTLPAGTNVEFVARENTSVHIRYAGRELIVPDSAVDLK